jgi:uncharacterized repeat protein (TIGR03837 family)
VKPLSVVWIFCQVIDHYGDAGVCWRLARQLHSEYGIRVSLFIDAPQTLQGIAPGVPVDPPIGHGSAEAAPRLISWSGPDDASWLALAHPAPDLVISGFGCRLPAAALSARTREGRPTLRLILEYLSAEPWVAGFHSRISPNPADGLPSHYFFPGFTPDTGGLLHEHSLAEQRAAFVQPESPVRARFLERAGLPEADGRRRISVFCYRNAPVGPWLQALRQEAEHTLLIATAPVADLIFEAAGAHSGRSVWSSGRLEIRRIAMLAQDDYDHLLWDCDLNFVRGEDSWIRAHWAGKPFIWQPYPQPESAHLIKLDAFLDQMLAVSDGTGDPSAARALRTMMHAWTTGAGLAQAWEAYRPHLDKLRSVHTQWASRLESQTDLAHRLVEFSLNRI